MANATTYFKRNSKPCKQIRPCTHGASRMSSARRRSPGVTTGAQSLVGSARRNPHRGRCVRVLRGQGAQRLHFGRSLQGQFVLTGRERRGIGARREVRGGVAVGPCCFWTVVAVTRRAVSSSGPRYIMLELLRRPWGLRHPARVSVDDACSCSASG